MPSNPRLLERVLDAYRDGDLDECIRLVRTLVEAAPQATGPRQLLASLFASTFNGRQALVHYRRLLPQAVERGEVIRAIAFQKQIDVYERPESLVPGRWGDLQKRLRLRGLPFAIEAPGSGGRPWVETQLLALPRAWFERIAAETRFEIMGLEPRAIDVEPGTVWEILAGRMRWSFGLSDGRASAEALAAEGDVVHVDPELASSAQVNIVPELPVEALRFDAALARDLRRTLAAGPEAATIASEGLTPEARALLPTRPRRLEDIDDLPLIPEGLEGAEPLRLSALGDEALEPPPLGDRGDWVEFGVVSLEGPPAANLGAGEVAPPPEEPAGEPVEPLILESLAPDGSGPPPAEARPTESLAAEASGSPAAEPLPVEPLSAEASGGTGPAPLEPSEVAPTSQGLPAGWDPPPAFVQEWERANAAAAGRDPAEADAVPSTAGVDTPAAGDGDLPPAESEPSLAPLVEGEPQIERRRHPRVLVSFESRVALLRLSGASVAPLKGQLGDLSTSGFSLRFPSTDLGASRAALADAVVAVDMDLPDPRGALRLAAQVRWLDADEPGEGARLGIEFVLLTEPDRRRIAGTLARAALAAHEAERRAARKAA